jgi:hypothetical protein
MRRWGWRKFNAVRNWFKPNNFSAADHFLARYNAADHSGAQLVRGSGLASLSPWFTSTPNAYLHHARSLDPGVKLSARLSGVKLSLNDIQPDQRRPGGVFLIGTNGLLLASTPGPFALKTALLNRNCARVPDATEPNIWKFASEQFAGLCHERCPDPLIPTELRTWLAGRKPGFRTREIENTITAIEMGDLEIFTPTDVETEAPDSLIQVIAKTGNRMHEKNDEMLHGKIADVLGEECVLGTKPRTIQSIPIMTQLCLQPCITSAAERLKYVLHEPFSFESGGNSRTFFCRFTSGMTGTDMSLWLAQAHDMIANGTVGIMVCGDDSFTVLENNGIAEYVGVDYSHYDQSQKQPQVNAELRCLRGLGVPNAILDILKQISINTAYSNSRSQTPKPVLKFVPAGPTRITGGPNTSLSNSTNNLIAIMTYILQGRQSTTWAKLGLTAKVETNTDLLKVQFLRGVFWTYDNPIGGEPLHLWGPMPSAILKLGKVMTVVKTIKRLKQLAYGQGLGMGDVTHDFPILGSLKRLLITLGSVNPSLRHEYNPLPAYADGLHREEVLSWMVERYGVTRIEIAEVEDELEDVTELPWFIGHPLFKAMMIDYA